MIQHVMLLKLEHIPHVIQDHVFNASNGGSWIRFVGSGGTIIPLTSPGMYHCGGYLSGWYNGTLPTTAGVASQ